MSRDLFGREIDYLRISVTEECNLRCTYCMPLSAPFRAPDERLLRPQEIGLVVRAAVSLGFGKFRLTGGEPTTRPDILEIVREVAGIPGVRDLAMTTNGVLLERLARPLRDAGLGRVNVHLDTLDEKRLTRLMRRGTVRTILRGIHAAEAVGFSPLKLNVVVVRDANDGDVVDLARLTLERDWHVRFIELMPLGGGECGRVATSGFVSNADTRARIEASLGPLEAIPGGDGECRSHRLPGATGVIGFISPVSEPYCGGCRRMRLTADGRFHLCLLRDDELDVRTAIRAGGGEAAVREILGRAVLEKPVGHRLHDGVSTRERAMHAIGG